MKKKIFWLDEFKDGKAQGGYYFRAFDLIKFMKLVEKEKQMGKQNDKLFKNIEEYAKKEKTKQQESKILGQKPAKTTKNKEKSIWIRGN